MEQITKHVYAETKIRGCNPGIILTDKSSVFVDTAQHITPLLSMIRFAEERTTIKYLINTEGHIDHVFGNHWFRDRCPIIGHEKLPPMFDMEDFYEYSLDVITRQDKAGLPLLPKKEQYVVKRPDILFSDRMSLCIDGLAIELLHTPGHTPSNISVYIPEDKVVFVGDTVFAYCQTWLQSANPDDLLQSLDRIRALDVDYIVPGHGPVVDKSYLDTQVAFIYEWIAAVAVGISKGWTLEECTERINFRDRYPVDIGQAEAMDYIQTSNIRVLFNYLTNGRGKNTNDSNRA